jgi:hypothetical protein
MIGASMGFQFFGGLLQCHILWYMGGTCDNKEGDSKREQRILGLRSTMYTVDDIAVIILPTICDLFTHLNFSLEFILRVGIMWSL